MNALLPIFIFVIIVIVFLNRFGKPVTKQTNIRLSRKFHYSLLITYIAIVLILSIIAEVMETTNHAQLVEPTSKTYINFGEAIHNGDEVDPSQIIDIRTHSVGKSLTILNTFDVASVYIERKSVNDGKIEEIIYKPMLYVNKYGKEYDFSEKVSVIKPKWENDTVSFSANPYFVVKYVSYHDASLVNQLTKTGFQDSSGYGSTSRSLVVRLIVPKDLVIDLTNADNIEFINE